MGPPKWGGGLGRGGWDPQSFKKFFVPPAQIPLSRRRAPLWFHRERTRPVGSATRFPIICFHNKPLPWALNPANVGTRHPLEKTSV